MGFLDKLLGRESREQPAEPAARQEPAAPVETAADEPAAPADQPESGDETA